MPNHGPIYTALDAARAAQSGAFIAAWPADESFPPLPSVADLSKQMRPPSSPSARGPAHPILPSSTSSAM
ncbi:hypothetical protein DCS_07314 [Drechmeria coniospora]|uniref:Uncharacterized protein n=1 Tax=Drechmeria coniospora TaxID=98403 RepID=A0A151GE59_DRECN|nr:hypothetical protein DCS_07314 [Drechmeria coniospora]KYK55351.1 hypothetical protein DCS_07314 [Drechmeria coniospora]